MKRRKQQDDGPGLVIKDRPPPGWDVIDMGRRRGVFPTAEELNPPKPLPN